ncbi:hypothetical protein Tco_1402953 [Tanacetum coccineum]
MANLSRNGSDALTEVHNQDNLNYDLFTQSEQIMTSSEQSNDVSQSETDIISDSISFLILSILSETQVKLFRIPNSSASTKMSWILFGRETKVENSFSGSLDSFDEIGRLKQNLFEQSYWKATSVPALDPSHSSTTVIVEVPKELPTVSMVNTSLKELKRFSYGDQVVKESTTCTLSLRAVENKHRLKSRTFEIKMNQVLSENERLLAQAIDKDIVKTVVNLSVNANGENVTECQKCLELETELVKKKDFVDKETYDKSLLTTLEQTLHHFSEPITTYQENFFKKKHSVLNQNAPRVTTSTSASGSQPSGNTRNDKILQTPSSNSKNKVEAHPRNVKSSLNKRNGTVKSNGSASVQKSKKQDDSNSVCVNSNDCMPSDNLCVSNTVNVVKSHAKLKKNNLRKIFGNQQERCSLR